VGGGGRHWHGPRSSPSNAAHVIGISPAASSVLCFRAPPARFGTRAAGRWLSRQRSCGRRAREKPMTRPSPGPPDQHAMPPRRSFLIGAGATGVALGTSLSAAYTQVANAPDHSLTIAPMRLELAPGKVIDTFAYNGTVPGPLLRLREGQPVTVDIRND